MTAPPLVNMNRNTTLIATELVTDGKKNAVRKNDLALEQPLVDAPGRGTAPARSAAGTTIST